jgi:hypothetical protein
MLSRPPEARNGGPRPMEQNQCNIGCRCARISSVIWSAASLGRSWSFCWEGFDTAQLAAARDLLHARLQLRARPSYLAQLSWWRRKRAGKKAAAQTVPSLPLAAADAVLVRRLPKLDLHQDRLAQQHHVRQLIRAYTLLSQWMVSQI